MDARQQFVDARSIRSRTKGAIQRDDIGARFRNFGGRVKCRRDVDAAIALLVQSDHGQFHRSFDRPDIGRSIGAYRRRAPDLRCYRHLRHHLGAMQRLVR